MIVVNKRRRNLLSLETVYFPDDYTRYASEADIVLFYFSRQPAPGAREFNTLHMDLTKTEDQLMNELHNSLRKDIKKIQRDSAVTVVHIDDPAEKDMDEFCKHYDVFAGMKGIKTADKALLKEFKDQGVLMLKTAYGSDGNILCSLCNIHTGDTVLGFYGYSNFRLYEDSAMRRFIANSNKYLYWQNILMLQAGGYKLLDMGGLGLGKEGSGMDNVDDFKLKFGGRIEKLYHFYHPLTLKGKIALRLLNLNSRIEF